MNDVAPQKTENRAPISAGGNIAGIVPKDIDQAYRLSQALARAGDMIPDHFKNKPDQIMAAVMCGAEVGLAPMQALANIAVINGRATLWGDAIPALLQRHGHHIDCVVEGEGDKMIATATLTRGDTKKTITRSFSMMDAKLAGLAGKGPYKSYPKRMISMRARTWAARDGASDALMGMQVAEEVMDYPSGIRDVTPAVDGFAATAMAARHEAITDHDRDINADLQGSDRTPVAHGADQAGAASNEEPGRVAPDAGGIAGGADKPPEAPEIDPSDPSFLKGLKAGREGFPGRDEGPLKQLPEEHAKWLAGYDAGVYERAAATTDNETA